MSLPWAQPPLKHDPFSVRNNCMEVSKYVRSIAQMSRRWPESSGRLSLMEIKWSFCCKASASGLTMFGRPQARSFSKIPWCRFCSIHFSPKNSRAFGFAPMQLNSAPASRSNCFSSSFPGNRTLRSTQGTEILM